MYPLYASSNTVSRRTIESVRLIQVNQPNRGPAKLSSPNLQRHYRPLEDQANSIPDGRAREPRQLAQRFVCRSRRKKSILLLRQRAQFQATRDC